jgi:hypothetical protein
LLILFKLPYGARAARNSARTGCWPPAGAPPQLLIGSVHAAVEAFSNGRTRDDIALLATQAAPRSIRAGRQVAPASGQR